MNSGSQRARPLGGGQPGRARRGKRGGDPEPIGNSLGAVIDRLGGALSAEEPGVPALRDVIDPELAGRTSMSYRDGELLVVAATNADATLLGYEKSTLARWALDVYSLGAEPRVRVVVDRGNRR